MSGRRSNRTSSALSPGVAEWQVRQEVEDVDQVGCRPVNRRAVQAAAGVERAEEILQIGNAQAEQIRRKHLHGRRVHGRRLAQQQQRGVCLVRGLGIDSPCGVDPAE